jgi:hypothetical protein
LSAGQAIRVLLGIFSRMTRYDEAPVIFADPESALTAICQAAPVEATTESC